MKLSEFIVALQEIYQTHVGDNGPDLEVLAEETFMSSSVPVIGYDGKGQKVVLI